MDDPRRFHVEDRDIGGAARGKAGGRQSEYGCGPGRPSAQPFEGRYLARSDQQGPRDADGCLQAHDAKRSAQKSAGLFVRAVRRVVGRETGNGSVHDGAFKGRSVAAGTERRIHFEIRIGGVDVLVAEGEVVRRQFRGDGRASRARRADQVGGRGG